MVGGGRGEEGRDLETAWSIEAACAPVDWLKYAATPAGSGARAGDPHRFVCSLHSFCGEYIFIISPYFNVLIVLYPKITFKLVLLFE